MEFLFRFHRGSFDASMSTKVSFDTFNDLISYILCTFSVSSDKLHFTLYGFDHRLDSYTFLLQVDYVPVGFIWFEK